MNCCKWTQKKKYSSKLVLVSLFPQWFTNCTFHMLDMNLRSRKPLSNLVVQSASNLSTHFLRNNKDCLMIIWSLVLLYYLLFLLFPSPLYVDAFGITIVVWMCVQCSLCCHLVIESSVLIPALRKNIKTQHSLS